MDLWVNIRIIIQIQKEEVAVQFMSIEKNEQIHFDEEKRERALKLVPKKISVAKKFEEFFLYMTSDQQHEGRVLMARQIVAMNEEPIYGHMANAMALACSRDLRSRSTSIGAKYAQVEKFLLDALACYEYAGVDAQNMFNKVYEWVHKKMDAELLHYDYGE